MSELNINLFRDLKEKRVHQTKPPFVTGLRTGYIRAWLFVVFKVWLVMALINGVNTMDKIEKDIVLLDSYVRNDFTRPEIFFDEPVYTRIITKSNAYSKNNESFYAPQVAGDVVVATNIQTPSLSGAGNTPNLVSTSFTPQTNPVSVNGVSQQFVQQTAGYVIARAIEYGFVMGNGSNLRGCLQVQPEGTLHGTGQQCRAGGGGGGGSTTSIVDLGIGDAVTGATEGSVLFAGSGGVISQNNTNFFWDNTAHYLTVSDPTDGFVGLGTGELNVVSSGAKTGFNMASSIVNTATSSTNTINKIGLSVASTGTWNGANSNNYALKVEPAAGGTNNFNIYSGADYSGLATYGSNYVTGASNAFVNKDSKDVALSIYNQKSSGVTVQGLSVVANSTSTSVSQVPVGANIEVQASGSATLPLMNAVNGFAWNYGSGNITKMFGVAGQAEHDGPGTVSLMASLVAYRNYGSGGAITNNSGLYLEDQSPVDTAVNNYQIYSAGLSPFVVKSDGKVGIGVSSPSAKLHVENTAQTIGSNLISNGTFTGNATGWTLGDCAAYSANSVTVTYTACSDPNLSTSVNLVAGHNYKLTFTITTTGDQVYPWFNNNGAYFDDGPYSTGTHTIYLSSDYTGVDDLYFESWDYNNDASWTIDNITFTEVSVTPTLIVKDYKNADLINLGNGFADNIGIGANTLQGVSTGINNNALGSNALFSNTTGSNNVAMGTQALYTNTIGSSNIAVGYKTLFSSLDGTDNTAVGYMSMERNTSGSYNTALGTQALNHNTIGQSNVALGQFTMVSNTEGSNNVAVGSMTMYSNTTGNNNVAVGIGSLQGNNIGFSNVAIGNNAMVFNTTGNNNVAFGENALAGFNPGFAQTGFHNIAIGSRSLYANSSGQSNTAIGYETMFGNLTGFYNTVVGESAFFGNESGAQNTIVGHEAGRGVAGSSNIDQSSILGFQAGYALLSGGFGNTLFGYKAGDNITTGSKNIVIGYDVEAPTATSTQTLNIGNLVFATGLNGTGTTLSTGSVGIGTSSPSTKLEIGSADLGNGAAGPIITLGRNTNGTATGAGSINFQSKSGTAGYVWRDNAGNMRINTSAPTNALDTSGTVIGTQSSVRSTKQDITDYTDYGAALQMVADAPLHTFRYIKDVEGYGSDSPLAKARLGYIADEVSGMFMWGNTIDQVSVNGILMASVKALNNKIENINTTVQSNNQFGNLQFAQPNNANTPIVLQSHLYLSSDSVGQAKISSGDTSVRITFSKPYQYMPIVTTTPNSKVGSEYWVSDKNEFGFTINIDSSTNHDVIFDWHSFAGPSTKLFVSNSSSSDVELTVSNVSDAEAVTNGTDQGNEQSTDTSSNQSVETPSVGNSTNDGGDPLLESSTGSTSESSSVVESSSPDNIN